MVFEVSQYQAMFEPHVSKTNVTLSRISERPCGKDAFESSFLL
jgi:hypothetical protein